MITIAKCFSALIASGNGARCSDLRHKLGECLLVEDVGTGIPKVVLFKDGAEDYPEEVEKISIELANALNPLYEDIEDFYFGKDLNKDIENYN